MKRFNILLLVIALLGCELTPTPALLEMIEVPVQLTAYADQDTEMYIVYDYNYAEVEIFNLKAGDSLIVHIIAKHGQRIMWVDRSHQDNYHLFYSIEQMKYGYQYDQVSCSNHCLGKSSGLDINVVK